MGLLHQEHQGLSQIWKTLADPSPNSAPLQVTVDQGRNGFESADSRFLYYSKSDRIWRKDLISGNESIVSELSDFPIARYWHLSTDSIYFVGENNPAPMVVNRFNLNTKKIEEARRLEGLSVEVDTRIGSLTGSKISGCQLCHLQNWRCYADRNTGGESRSQNWLSVCEQYRRRVTGLHLSVIFRLRRRHLTPNRPVRRADCHRCKKSQSSCPPKKAAGASRHPAKMSALDTHTRRN
jgi:phosphoribosyl-AMP cyclohydrolase